MMSAEYFRLLQSKKVVSPIRIDGLDRDAYRYKMDGAAFAALDDLVVAYYSPADGLEICEVLRSPCFVIAERLKELWLLLQPDLAFKGIQLFPDNFRAGEALKDPTPLYWVPYLAPTVCLHESSGVYDTGIVHDLVLTKSAVADKNILKVAGTVEEFWIVSLTAAECILRRGALGAALERVKVRD